MTTNPFKYVAAADPPVSIRILQLLNVPESQMKRLVASAIEKAQNDREQLETATVDDVIELIVELLVRRFPHYGRAKIQELLPAHFDIRDTELWRKAVREGREEQLELVAAKSAKRKEAEIVRRCVAQGRTAQEIAAIIGIPLKEVRRLAKGAAT